MPAAEWKFFMDDGEMSRAPKGRMETVFKNLRRVFDALGRKVTPYEAGKEIAPGITSVATVGHTPGHNSHIIASGNSKVFVQGDVTHVPFLFVRNPGWHAFYDQDGAMAEATRRKVYDMLVAEKMLVQGFHYPFPSLAHVEKSGSGYREIPVPWNPTILNPLRGEFEGRPCGRPCLNSGVAHLSSGRLPNGVPARAGRHVLVEEATLN